MIEYLVLVLIVEMIIFFGLHILGLFMMLFTEHDEPTAQGVLVSSEDGERMLREILGDEDD